MTPTRAQIFYARNWPMRLWFSIVPVVLGTFLARTYGLKPGMLREPRGWGTAALCWLLGLLVSALTGWFILGPAYYARGITNGAPYQVGDTVRILVGRNRGQILRVAEVPEERDQVRVEGGDLYGYTQICRAQD
jgi:hypothetical protein